MPGLTKVRRVQTTSRRALDLVGVREGWFSTLLETADIVSEGAVQDVDAVRSYFGSTSLRCPLRAHVTFEGSGADASALAQLVVRDPNAKLRLLRLAHREAVSRAGRSLGVLTAEISAVVVEDATLGAMLAIDIDVSADISADDERASPELEAEG